MSLNTLYNKVNLNNILDQIYIIGSDKGNRFRKI